MDPEELKFREFIAAAIKRNKLLRENLEEKKRQDKRLKKLEK